MPFLRGLLRRLQARALSNKLWSHYTFRQRFVGKGLSAKAWLLVFCQTCR
jgi:hypothetical protein